MAAYCVIKGIDYIVEECPMAIGNKHIRYKEALNELELASPGTKRDFYLGFLRNAVDVFAADDAANKASLGSCERCGGPANSEVCAFCRLAEKASAHEPVPVAMPRRKKKATTESL